jgi:hypothetical protein
MKKLFLTLITAAAFCVAAMAQQPQPRKESDEYRRTKKTEELSKQRQDSTIENIEDDSLGNDQYRQDQADTLEQDTTQQQTDEYRRSDEDPQRRQNVQQRTDLGDEGVNQQEGNISRQDTTGQDPQSGQGVQEERDLPSGREDLDTTGQGMQQTDAATSKVKPEAGQPGQTEQVGSGQPAMTHNVEVVEDKEGPEGQVVYKMNDAYYYIDQDKQRKLVKIDESELKDVKHKVTVKTGSSKTGYSKSKSKRSSKG